MNEDPFLNDPDVFQKEINALFSRYNNSLKAIRRYEGLVRLVTNGIAEPVGGDKGSLIILTDLGRHVEEEFSVFSIDLLLAIRKKLDASRVENVKSFNQLHAIRKALDKHLESPKGGESAGDGRDS